MTFPVAWFPALAKALAADLAEGRVQAVRSPRPHEIVLEARTRGESVEVLLSAHDRFPRVHRIAGASPTGQAATDFAMVLRKHALGARVESVRAVPGERVLEILLSGRTGALCLVAECIPGKADLVLVGADGTILGVQRPRRGGARELAAGMPYAPPPPAPRRAEPPPVPGAEGDPGDAPPGPEGEGEAGGPPAGFPDGLEAEFRGREEAFERGRLALAAGRVLRKARHKEDKRILNLRRDLEGAGDPEEWRTRGELLKIHAGRVQKGAREVEVPNLFLPDAPPLVIPLDPRLDLQGNMEDFFRRYRKARNGRKKIHSLLAEANARLEEIERRSRRLEAASAAGDGEALAALAGELGIPLDEEAPAPAAKAKAKPEPRLPYRRFVSAEGLEIWVGRDARENDRLTRSDARGDDVWMHVGGAAGSHVVVKVRKGQEPAWETLLDAASLAAFFSQGRGRPAEVSYTRAKNVRKPRNAKPGLVMMADRRAIRVAPDAERLARLLGKKPADR
ncbi:MAG: NFACT RNA binding domain-containing protein [Planctomycetes bacterium]|nr:NFACT RNA binding domain-containing protein [Planctomycetota bacterium]